MSSTTGRIGTRSSNSSKHPGLANKGTVRRTSAEVKAAAKAKEAAKNAKKKAHEARIQRVAEFESMAKTNEETMDATPRPNFAPRVNHTSPGPGSDISLAPPGESDGNNLPDSAILAETPAPKKIPAVKAKNSKKLTTNAENSGDESEPLSLNIPRGRPVYPAPVLEETDTDGDSPPMRSWRRKRDARRAAQDEPEDSESVVAEEKDLPPPSKKSRNSNVEKPQLEAGRKKKESVHNAIAAIQQEMSADSGQAREKQKEDEVTVIEPEGNLRKSQSAGSKRFGDGPQWKRQEEENAGGSLKKRPNQNKDQIGLPGHGDTT